MFSNVLLAPSFRLLLEQLLSELSNARSSDGEGSLAPGWLVTPTSSLAGFLRARLAREAGNGVIPAIGVVPLPSFVDRLSDLPGAPDSGPRWSHLLDLRLHQLVAESPLGPRLAPLKRMRGGHGLLRSTFLDLAEAGFGLEHTDLLVQVAAESDVNDTGAEVIALYLVWLARLRHWDLAWGPLSQQALPERLRAASDEDLAAVLGASTPADTRVWVYGFYDFTDVNIDALAALARRVSTTFLIPYAGSGSAPHHAFTVVQPVLEDLSVRLGSVLARPATLDAPAGGPLHFFMSTFPEGEIGPQPSFITYQRASGLRAEVISAALRIRSWLDDPSLRLRPEDIFIVAPEAASYSDLVRQIIPAFGIPVRLLDVPDPLTPADRALRALARLWDEQAPTEWLFGYWREFPQLGCLDRINLDSFERKIREISFDGRNWPGLLEMDKAISLNKAERALIQEIIALWTRPSAAETIRVSDALRDLQAIAARWLPDPALAGEMLELLGSLPQEEAISARLLQDLLLSRIGREVITDPPAKGGVVFAPLMRARGFTPRAIVLLGLASGRLPFQIQEDPLLADGLRSRLSRKFSDLGHRLPPKSAATEEMTLLFMLMNGSAELIHWVVPDTDEQGRTVAPTPWVQRYLQRWEVEGTARGPWPPVPRGPAEQARLLLSLDPASARFLPPAFAAYLDRRLGSLGQTPETLEALERLLRRDTDPDWNGVVPEARFPLRKEPTTIRVTEIEKLSRCPFQFYSLGVARWETLVPLEFSQDLRSTDWGTVLHRLFEDSIGSLHDQGLTLRQMAEVLLADGAARLLFEIGAIAPEASPPYALLHPLFRQAADRKLFEQACAYWEAVRADVIPDGHNVCTERRLSVPYPGLAGVVVSGQIDRMDDRHGERVIIDYKSGREPDALDKEVRAGFRLQPLLYRWLEQRSHGRRIDPATFAYVFFGRSPLEERAVDDEDLGAAETWLSTVFLPILREGLYLPVSSEALEYLGIEKLDPCQYCECASLCRRFARGAPRRFGELVGKLLPHRLEKFESPAPRSEKP